MHEHNPFQTFKTNEPQEKKRKKQKKHKKNGKNRKPEKPVRFKTETSQKKIWGQGNQESDRRKRQVGLLG